MVSRSTWNTNQILAICNCHAPTLFAGVANIIVLCQPTTYGSVNLNVNLNIYIFIYMILLKVSFTTTRQVHVIVHHQGPPARSIPAKSIPPAQSQFLHPAIVLRGGGTRSHHQDQTPKQFPPDPAVVFRMRVGGVPLVSGIGMSLRIVESDALAVLFQTANDVGAGCALNADGGNGLVPRQPVFRAQRVKECVRGRPRQGMVIVDRDRRQGVHSGTTSVFEFRL